RHRRRRRPDRHRDGRRAGRGGSRRPDGLRGPTRPHPRRTGTPHHGRPARGAGRRRPRAARRAGGAAGTRRPRRRRPPGRAGAGGLSTDGRGRLLTDETLTSVDDDRVVGAGDAVAPAGPALSMGCRSAAPLGAMAADTVLSRVAGTRPAAVDLGFYAIGVSVGRTVATVQLTERDDSPRETVFAGRLAARLKDAGLTGAVLALRLEGVRPGSAVWPRRASLTGRQPRLLSSRR